MEYILGYNLFESKSNPPTFGKDVKGNLVVGIDGKTLTFEIKGYGKKVPFIGEPSAVVSLVKISTSPDGKIELELDVPFRKENEKTSLSLPRKDKIIKQIRDDLKTMDKGYKVTSYPETTEQRKFDLILLSIK